MASCRKSPTILFGFSRAASPPRHSSKKLASDSAPRTSPAPAAGKRRKRRKLGKAWPCRDRQARETAERAKLLPAAASDRCASTADLNQGIRESSARIAQE